MKFANRHKQLVTGTSTTNLTLGAAMAGFRPLSKVITNGASDPLAIKVGDTNVPFIVDDGAGNWLHGLYTITSDTQLTRTAILDSSADGADVTLTGNAAVVYSSLPAQFAAKSITTDDGLALNQLTRILTSGMTGAAIIPMSLDGTNVGYATLADLQSYLGVSGSAPATVSGVSVSPTTASLGGNSTQQFSAVVLGTNSPSQSVTWSASAGSITSGGLFTAPAGTTSPQTITITATSTFDTTKSGTAQVTVPASNSTVSGVTISPSTANANPGAQQQFTATVAGTNSPSQNVTWGASAGTISGTGLWTAPAGTLSTQTVTITAISVQDNTKQGSATVTVAASTVTGVTVTPTGQTVNGGGTQQFSASVAGTNNPSQNVTWSATAGSITSGGLFTAPASTGSAQTVTITATSTLDGTKSGTTTVTVAASTVTGVSVTPSTANVAGGGTQQFSATVSGTNSPSQSVSWAATAGSINSSGLFTAPAGTSSAQTITITATSNQNNTKSATATVTVPAVAPTFHFDGNYSTFQNSVSYGASSYGSFAEAVYIKDASNNGIDFSTYDVYLVVHNSATVAPTNGDSLHATHSNTFNLCTNPGSTPGLASGNSIFVYKDTFPAGTYYLWAIVVAKGAGQTGTPVWQKAYDGTNTGTAVALTVNN